MLLAPVAEARVWVGIGSGRTRWRCGGRGGRRRRGNRARCPLSVAVIAVTGTVLAVGGSVTGAVTAVTRGRESVTPAPAVTVPR